MEFLGSLPCAPPAILPEMLHDEPHVVEMFHAGIGMTEPEAFGEASNQIIGTFHQFRRRRNRRGGFLQFL